MRPRRTLKPNNTPNRTVILGLALLFGVIAIPLSAADWNAGVAAYKAGELQRAIDEFTGYVEARPDVYQGHQMLGLALYRSGDAGRAASHFGRATELAPERADLRLLWARALHADGDAKGACEAMSSLDATTLDERNATTLLQLRAKAACGGDRLTALGDLARATNDAATWAAYGAAALEAEDLETARDAAAAAAAKAPTDAKVQRLYARVLVAVATEVTGDERTALYDEAVAPARIAYEAAGDVTSALVYADALMGADRAAEVEAPLAAVLAQEPTHWAATFTLARVHAKLGEVAKAEAGFDRALELATDEGARTESLTAKARLLEADERYAEAAEVFTTAGADADAARNLENARIVEENADVDEFNRRRAELIAQRAEAERDLARMREGGPPPPN